MRRVFQIAVAAYLWTGLEVDGVTNNRIGRRDYCGVDEIGLCCEVYLYFSKLGDRYMAFS